MLHATQGSASTRQDTTQQGLPASQADVANFTRFWHPHLLAAAIKLGLPDHLAAAPAPVDALATALHADPVALGRLVRALVANGYFTQVDGDRIAHNEASQSLRRDSPVGLRGMILLFAAPFMQSAWSCLAEGISTGSTPFELAHGQSLYTYLESHKEEAAVFNEAMVAFTAAHAADVIRGYPDLRLATNILDLAGGVGHFLVALLQASPAARGAVLDLEHARKGAQARMAAAKLEQRSQFILGDFLREVPKGFDLCVIKNALFNWPDDDVVKVLRNVRRALEPEGRLLIVEWLIVPSNAAWSTMMDIQMMVAPNGRCRTVPEYQELLEQADLYIAEVFDFGSTLGIACTTAPPMHA